MSKTKKENKKLWNAVNIILALGVLAFFASVVYLNFKRVPAFFNGDIYSDIDFAVKAWTEKTLFPSGWVYGNQIYVISTPVVAALMMGIFKNGFLAMAAASSLMTVLIFISVNYMLRPFVNLTARLGGFLMFVSFSALLDHVVSSYSGWQLFFTMGSYYACYIITAAVCFGCYARVWAKKTGVCTLIMMIVACALSFATGMQSLRQTEAMILPLIVTEIFIIISEKRNKKKFNKKLFLSVVLLTLSNAAGIIYAKTLKLNHVEIFNDSSVSKKPEWTNLKKMIAYAIRTFQGSINLKTCKPLVCISYAVVFAIVAVALVIMTVRFIKRKKADALTIIAVPIAFGFCGMAVLFFFSSMEIRNVYFFMTHLLIAVLTAYLINEKKIKPIAVACVLTCFILAVVIRIVPAIKDANDKEISKMYTEAADYITENNYDVFYANWLTTGRVACAADSKLEAGMWNTDTKDSVFIPVDYICNPEIFNKTDNAVYIIHSSAYNLAKKKAAEKGAEIEVLYTTDATIKMGKFTEHLIIFTASKPIWQREPNIR